LSLELQLLTRNSHSVAASYGNTTPGTAEVATRAGKFA